MNLRAVWLRYYAKLSVSALNTIKEEKKLCTLVYSLSLPRKLNKNPLTIRRAKGLGILRHNLPSMYATMPDNKNLPTPHFQMNLAFCLSPVGFAGTSDLSSSLSDSLFHLMLAVNLSVCFLSARIAKLTNMCSHNVCNVGPIFHSCGQTNPRWVILKDLNGFGTFVNIYHQHIEMFSILIIN